MYNFQEARDDIRKLQSMLEIHEYTPSFTATNTNPVLGTGGELYGQYMMLGDLVYVAVRARFGTATINRGDGLYMFSLPVPADVDTFNIPSPGTGTAVGLIIGAGAIRDQSTGASQNCTVQLHGNGTHVFLNALNSTSGNGVAVQDDNVVTFDAQDVISFTAWYKAAEV